MDPYAQLTPKKLALRALDDLAEDATFEDVMERLFFFRQIQKGLQQVGQGIPQAEVEAEFRKRRDKRSWR